MVVAMGATVMQETLPSCIQVEKASSSRRSRQAQTNRNAWVCTSRQDMVVIAGGYALPGGYLTGNGACCMVRSRVLAGFRGKPGRDSELERFRGSRCSQRNPLLVECSIPGSVIEENSETIDAGPLARGSKLYRPAVILPGLGNNSSDYNALVKSLEALEVPTTVVRVARIDWLRNAAGLLDGNYWKGSLRPRPVLDWYFNRLKIAIEAAKAGAVENGKVSLIGHSAGGWLARVYMAEFGTDDIALLLTLGTPHLPPPRGEPGVFDQTRGLLYFVEENCPGAYHAPDVKYVCVAGRYVKGVGRGVGEKKPRIVTSGTGTLNLETLSSKDMEIEEDLVKSVSSNDTKQAEDIVNKLAVGQVQQDAATESRGTFRDRFIGAGYKQVCGRADVWGDGVVPEESAFLEGATNILLDGVYHSPVGANDLERPWYGSAGRIDQWASYLLE